MEEVPLWPLWPWEEISTTMTQVSELVAETARQIAPVITRMYDTINAAYLEDGAIYGDSHEGLIRWMQERGEINQLRAQANKIEQHQDSVRSFKRMIIAKRQEK